MRRRRARPRTPYRSARTSGGTVDQSIRVSCAVLILVMLAAVGILGLATYAVAYAVRLGLGL